RGVVAPRGVRNFAIPEPFPHTSHDFLLTARKQNSSLGIDHPHWQSFAQGFQEITQFFAVGPDLALADAVDTFGQRFQRVAAGEYAACSRSKRFHHLRTLWR